MWDNRAILWNIWTKPPWRKHIRRHLFSLVISGNHHESLLVLLKSYQTPLVLGYPWLWLHNPRINWVLGKILGCSAHCHVMCLKSILPPAAEVPSTTKTSLSPLSNGSTEYLDLCKVFSKSRALSLPPHCPYDHDINLLPGAPLPSSHLHNLSRPERVAMEKYTIGSLATGIIRPSFSTLGTKSFFWRKKGNNIRLFIEF